MAGLARPWASWDDARFWGQLLGYALVGASVVVAGALLAWALVLQPSAGWWHGAGFTIARAPGAWRHWLHVAIAAEGVVGTLFFALLAWYCDGMLRGSGKAEH